MAKTYLCLFFLTKLGSFTIKLVIDNHKRYNHATEVSSTDIPSGIYS